MNKFLFLVLFLVSKLVNAQVADTLDLYSLSLAELLNIKVLGVTRTEENLSTVPAAVTVYTHDQIESMGLDFLDELMNFVPGYQSYRAEVNQVHYVYSSRAKRIGTATAEVLVLVDGQRMDNSRTSGNMLTRYPLNHVERVEFIRGPGSAAYGSNAMMGVINIVTRSGVNEVSANYGSFNRLKFHFLFSKKIKSFNVDLFANYDSDEGDNYTLHNRYTNSPYNTDDPRRFVNLSLKLNWKSTYLYVQHNQHKAENFYTFGGLNNDINQSKSRLTAISLKQEMKWKKIKSHLWLSWRVTNLNLMSQLTAPGVFDSISSPSSSAPLLSESKVGNFYEIQSYWHNNWEIHDDNNIQFGMEYRNLYGNAISNRNYDMVAFANNDLPIQYFGTLSSNTPVQEAKRDIFGLYLQNMLTFFKATHLTLGLRFDAFSNIGNNVSPKISLVQEINKHHIVKLLYGEAFRAPSESELRLINNSIVEGNPDLTPEIVKTWELIWMGQWTNINMNLGYFNNQFSNSIVRTNRSPLVDKYLNSDQEPSKGFEIELAYATKNKLLIRAAYTHFIEMSSISFREAGALASFIVKYQRDKWNLILLTTYTGEREIITGGSANIRMTLDDYFVISTKVEYRLRANLHAFIKATNMSDNQYLTPGNAANLTEGVANRGREFLAGITWRLMARKME